MNTPTCVNVHKARNRTEMKFITKYFTTNNRKKKVSTLHSQFSEYVESEKHTQSVEEQQEKCNFYDRIYGGHESK